MDLPHTPPGAQAAWILSQLGAEPTDDEVRSRFAASFLEEFSAADIREFLRELNVALPIEIVKVTGNAQQQRALLRTAEGPMELSLLVETDEPHAISSLLIRPMKPSVSEIVRSAKPAEVETAIDEHVGPWAETLRGNKAGAVCGVYRDATMTMRRFGAVEEVAVFEIGSITKTATATLLATMVASNEVHLEDHAATFLPQGFSMPEGGADVTLLELATHSSGLPRLPANLVVHDRHDPYASFTVDELFAGLSATRLSDRGVVAYSNLGYALLGQCLARAAGEPFGRLLVSRVLAPLGMHDARVGPDAALEVRRVPGHLGGEIVPHWSRTATAPAGGIEACVADVLRYAVEHVKAPADSVLAQTHARRLPLGDGYIGLAWIIVPTEQGDVLWHNGGTGGFRSFLGIHPDSKTAIVVLSNTSDDDGPDAAGASVLGSIIKR